MKPLNCEVCAGPLSGGRYVIIYNPTENYQPDPGAHTEFLTVCGSCVTDAAEVRQEVNSLHSAVAVLLPADYHEYTAWLDDQHRSGPDTSYQTFRQETQS